MKILPEHIELWRGPLRNIKATHHTIELEEETRIIRQQVYRAGQKKRRGGS